MSLFRKPKKIQRRMFCADDDEDGEPEPPPPPVISRERERKENKPVKTKSLLSFADEEEEDAEVFKVKKSSQSKRLAKRREKERRKPPDGDNNKYDNNVNEDEAANNSNSQPQPKSKKKVTLEGLILSGREALAADGAGDVSDSPDEEEEDSRGFHKYRAETVRAALAVAPGHIPDAALIHAARKTRQQARELGDFVPIPSEAPPGSRLVRDDGSGDDDEDGRIQVRGLDLPSDKPKRGTAAAPTNEELDSEGEEWEEQQMQKAMPAISDIAGSMLHHGHFSWCYNSTFDVCQVHKLHKIFLKLILKIIT
ncbi:PAX3- and PAX7-binding protein 1-like [Ostrinia furnacalis]|uniref:PAX3- and PAX7-binding protein 1-like n=1 Tax=Ostrinia furnacalis TaxID=93504 RepID=UPI0010403AA3|nr:PAX3- and PAX7-binding protein 1-like [Ostrinia furnacalis]